MEFKTSFAEENKAIVSLGSFANAQGGTAFFGVRTDGTVCGVQIGANSLENFAGKLRRESQPPLSPQIDQVDIEGRIVVAVSVQPPRPGQLFHVFNTAYVRVGRTNQVMSPDEQRARLLRGQSPSAEGHDRPFIPWPTRAGAPQFRMHPGIDKGKLLCEFVISNASPAPGGLEVRWLGAGTNMDWTTPMPGNVPRGVSSQKYQMKSTEMTPAPPADDVTLEVRFNLEDGLHGGRWTWPIHQHETKGHWILDSHLGSGVHQPLAEDAW